MLQPFHLPPQGGRRFFLLKISIALLFFGFAFSIPAVELHKLEVSDPVTAGQILTEGGRLLADYGTYQLYEAPRNNAAIAALKPVEVRDQYDFVLLNSRRLNTRAAATKALSATMSTFKGKRLHLVQFVGPIQPLWRNQLEAAGLQILSYIPHNTYLVYGDTISVRRAQALAASTSHIQWQAPYLDSYKIHPQANPFDAHGNPQNTGTDLFAIQLVADTTANAATDALLDQLKLEPVRRKSSIPHYVNLVARVKPEALAAIAAQPDVISIAPYFPRHKFDERQDQTIAGKLSGGIPTGPGYLAWLASKGFTQQQFDTSGFVVDVTDSGIDNGSVAPNHFGLYTTGILTSPSRVAYNRLEGTANPGSTLVGCDGHGNLNSHIIGGYDDLSGFPFADTSGFHYGLGVCPFVKVGSSVVFDPDFFTDPNYGNLQSEAYQNGARISNNSWGGFGDGSYDMDAQTYDALVRDAQPTGATYVADGNQEMVIVFASGNDGPVTQTVGSPATSKNVISVGASENVQAFGGMDSSGVADDEANNANDIVSFSSRGPCADGRHKPDIVAPGTHVSGGAPQSFNPGPTGTADPCFKANGTGVAGGPNRNKFWPLNQQFYTASSGTSHSTPCVAGACALIRQYFINNFSNPPSAAMTKAYLMNSARYLTGTNAGDALWSDSQGMGSVALDTAFDGASRVLRDQVAEDLFTVSGQSRIFTGHIADTNKPFRVTVAWTDAPGSTTGDAYVNDLDLVVTVGGVTYKGNVFHGAFSTPGGNADFRNNVESVFLPAGASGNFVVRINAIGINGIGVPNPNNALEQDFAVVIYNAQAADIPVISPGTAALLAETCSPVNNSVDPGETVTINFPLQNVGRTSTSNLIATLQPTGGVLAPSLPQSYGSLASGSGDSRAFTFTASGSCGGMMTATLTLQDSAAPTGLSDLGSVSFQLPLGTLTSGVITFTQNFDSVIAPALPAGWTSTASGAQLAWVTSTTNRDTIPNSVFSSDATNVGLATLVSPAILINSPTAKLTFRHNYDLEAGLSATTAYDGGVLEIQIGSGFFQDILSAGGTFVTGSYNRTISSSFSNPLGGRQTWSGDSGGFITTVVNLPAAAAGQTIHLRWLCGSDSSAGKTGWFVDSVSLSDGFYTCCQGLVAPWIVNMRSIEGMPIFSFQSLSGQTYRVEYKLDLPGSNWTILKNITGDGSLTTVTDSVATPQRFYRIRSP